LGPCGISQRKLVIYLDGYIAASDTLEQRVSQKLLLFRVSYIVEQGREGDVE